MNFYINLNDISVKVKIYILMGILIGALIISVMFALVSMSKIGKELEAIAETDIPLTKVITEITTYQLEQAINFERALRLAGNINKDPSAETHFKEAINYFYSLSGNVVEKVRLGEELAEEALTHSHTDKELSELKHIKEVLGNVKKEHDEYAEHAKHVFSLLSKGEMQAAFKAAKQVEKQEENISHELKMLTKEIEVFTEQAALNAMHHEQFAETNLMIIAIIAIIVSVLLGVFINIKISRGINRAVSAAEQIAAGILTEEIHTTGTDEIGKLLSSLGIMRNKLHAMIIEMGQSSTELAAASEELSAVTEDTNNGIHKQQDEIHKVATAMNEMNATVHEVASNAQLTAQSANEANNEAQAGQDVVEKNVISIESLAEAVDNAEIIIQKVGQESDNIGTILDVIKNIAEQTNLLALNAAIEAARAGEQGRGFAVVADEVRTLASRTQQSTSEIEEMILSLQENAKKAVQAMEVGREQASTSVEQAKIAGLSLKMITEVVLHISEMNTQIASAAEEQTCVAEEINRNVTNISDVAEQNASAVNQVTASSEELAQMAINLQTMIAQFEV